MATDDKQAKGRGRPTVDEKTVADIRRRLLANETPEDIYTALGERVGKTKIYELRRVLQAEQAALQNLVEQVKRSA